MIKNASTLRRADEVKRIVGLYYEPGRQDRCLSWVYRNHVYPAFGISKRSFFRYLKENPD